MKVHEYQAKEILGQYGVAVQYGEVAETVDEAVASAQRMSADGTNLFVVKAQIHAGGRGKGGGVKLAGSIDEVKEKAEAILGMQLVTPQTGPQGQEVRKILVTAAEDIAHEYYLGVTLDRARGQNVIMASTEGGVEIEEVAEATPEKIVKVYVDPAVGLRPFQAVEVASRLGFEGPAFKQTVKFVRALYRAYEESDATIAEINPLVLTDDGRVVALDAKINLDDNAMYRHADLAAMRDEREEDPLEVEAGRHNLSYIKLYGHVGCMGNGAELAMGRVGPPTRPGGGPGPGMYRWTRAWPVCSHACSTPTRSSSAVRAMPLSTVLPAATGLMTTGGGTPASASSMLARVATAHAGVGMPASSNRRLVSTLLIASRERALIDQLGCRRIELKNGALHVEEEEDVVAEYAERMEHEGRPDPWR